MLKEKNSRQHIANLEHLATEEARDIYRYMLGHAACLLDYECYPNKPTGANKRDFRYYKKDKQTFAFIINTKDLLFYFHTPAMEMYSFDDIKKIFPHARNDTNNKRQVIIRIKNLAEAKKLLGFIFS
jgi:hypothetical protein